MTGIGVITSLGCGWEKNSDAFQCGRRNFRPVTLFDTSRHRTKIAAEVELPDSIPVGKMSRSQQRRLDRAEKLLLIAADEAWQQAKLNVDKYLPVVLGTTSGGMAQGENYYKQAIQPPHSKRRQASRVIHYLSQSQPKVLAEAFGFDGPSLIIANACASGANAVGHAWEMVRNGSAKQVLTGGYDALSEMVFTGFDSLQALSPTQCRPFDARRDGLSLGEGAAVFILESLACAEKRGARVIAEICGYGAATDIHHLTQPHPNGDAALLAMTEACASAGVSPEKISYINAHGTGTPLNDSAEANAIARWAGEHVGKVFVSSTKASIGHLLGGAGAVETAICLMALEGQWLPPMTNLNEPDPICGFPLVREPMKVNFEFALSNSFGFGGANASLIFRRWS